MTKDFEKRYLNARRAVIESDFMNLNSMQREAVMATEGPLLILAGAGSGKTTVLISRIANLMKYGRASDSDELPPDADEQKLKILEAGGEAAREYARLDPVEPWRILAITFTNKAASELKERIAQKLGPDANDIWACTFHSACMRILRHDADKLGFSSSFSVYDTADSQSLIKRIVKDLDLDAKAFAPKAVLGEISRAKDSQLSPLDYMNRAELSKDMRKIKIAEIYKEYMRRLQAANAMDFDDLIYFTVMLLQQDEAVRAYWQRRFRYVLIDEYQDTNHLQYLFATTIAGGNTNLCVVGDDDQSIYKFRGATIENILSFEAEHKNCRTIRLEQNYRSKSHILDAANSVIRNNRGRKGKELWTNQDAGDMVELHVAETEQEEAQFVAGTIMASYSKGANWRDHAVLYRMNAQSSQLEFAFKRAGIPYRVFGGTRFFDRAEIKDMLAYLNLIVTPEDDLRLERVINSPPRGIGARSLELARELARENDTSMFEIIHRAESYSALKRPALQMRQFANMMLELREFAQNHTPDLVYDLLLEKTGYVRSLEVSGEDKDMTRVENIMELKSSIIAFMKDSGDLTLEGYLANVSLYTDMDNYDKEFDCVVMMTMHSAKGLEFPTVFIVGAEETIFPGMRAIGVPEEMEEERRLCYVAITRAKQRLYIVSAQRRMLFGRTTSNRVSRFVEEIAADHINKNIPKGYSYGESSVARDYPSMYTQRRSSTVPVISASPQTAKESPATPVFSLGDDVMHKAFGRGVIVKLSPMGGDYLVEINFEKLGTKKLMLRAAALHMEKL